MRCVNCSHSNLDHASGRCVVRSERLHRASGVLVVTVCGCKRYVTKSAAPVVVTPSEPLIEEPAEAPDETETQLVEPTT